MAVCVNAQMLVLAAIEKIHCCHGNAFSVFSKEAMPLSSVIDETSIQ